jgi:hypothetical protein
VTKRQSGLCKSSNWHRINTGKSPKAFRAYVNVFRWFTRSQRCVEHSEELSAPLYGNFATLWFLAPVDAASLRWCFNLKINSTKFINTYLRPMVTHYKNQGQEKWDSCRDTCNLSQILQLPGNDSNDLVRHRTEWLPEIIVLISSI